MSALIFLVLPLIVLAVLFFASLALVDFILHFRDLVS